MPLRPTNFGFGGLPEGGRPFAFGTGTMGGGTRTGGGGGATGGCTGGGGGGAGAGGGATDGLWDLSGALGCAFFLAVVKCARGFPDSFGTGNACFSSVFFPVVFVTYPAPFEILPKVCTVSLYAGLNERDSP